MRDLLTTLMELAGAALVVGGVSMFSVPLALILAGVFMVIGGWLFGAPKVETK